MYFSMVNIIYCDLKEQCLSHHSTLFLYDLNEILPKRCACTQAAQYD